MTRLSYETCRDACLRSRRRRTARRRARCCTRSASAASKRSRRSSDLHDCMKRRPPDLVLCEAQGAEAELCQDDPGPAAGRGRLQSLHRHHRHGLGKFRRAGQQRHQFRRRRSAAAPVLDRASGRSASAAMSSAARALSSPPIMSARTAARTTRALQCRAFPAAQFAEDEAQGAADRGRGGATPRRRAANPRARCCNTEKLRRDAFQICILWRLVQDNPPGTQRYDVDLAKLRGLTHSVMQRCAGTDYEPADRTWCDAVLGAIEGLELKVDRNASMHLLGHAALSLNQFFDAGKIPDRTSGRDRFHRRHHSCPASRNWPPSALPPSALRPDCRACSPSQGRGAGVDSNRLRISFCVWLPHHSRSRTDLHHASAISALSHRRKSFRTPRSPENIPLSPRGGMRKVASNSRSLSRPTARCVMPMW